MVIFENFNSQVTDIDYDIFSLPRKEVRIIKKSFVKELLLKIEIKGKVIKHKCPKCGSYNVIRVGKGYELHTVNHMHLSNYTVVQLDIYKRRFKCRDCYNNQNKGDKGTKSNQGSTFMERFSFLDLGCSYTNIFKSYILREWEYSSLSELSRKFLVSEKLIYQTIGSVNIEKLEKEKIEYLLSLEEIVIGIDEFAFSGKDFICQINEVLTKKVVGILKINSQKELQSWLDKLPIEVIKKIKGIASDMNNTYKSTIQSHIAKRLGISIGEVEQKVGGVVDHYHLKQLFSKLIMEVYSMNNWMIKAGHYDKITKDISTLEVKNFNKYRTDRLEFNVREFREYKPNDVEYKPITLGFFLSKRYSDLLLIKSEKLTLKQAHRLNQILFEFDPKGYLKEAYLGKELLNEAIKSKDISLVEKIINDFKDSIHYKIVTCAKTLEKWKTEINNFIKTGITNAFSEGKNTKAKLFKRMAYGYTKKENYIKRLLLCL